MADVSLTSGMRANLLQLQMTERLMDRTQGRIATGKKINSALDGPAAYFAAKALSDRAGDLSALKDNMGQAISTIKAADAAISKITDLVSQAKAIANTANQNLGSDDASVTSRSNSASQFDALLTQIDSMVDDASYAGKNLLLGDGSTTTATTVSISNINGMGGIADTSVTSATATDSYAISTTVGKYGRIDAGTSVTEAAAAIVTLDAATTEQVTTALTISGVMNVDTTQDVTLAYTSGSDTSTTTLTVTYNGESHVQDFTTSSSTDVTALLGGLTISFTVVQQGGTSAGAAATATAWDGDTAQDTDTRLIINSSEDSTTFDSGTVTYSTFADDASKTAGTSALVDGVLSSAFTTGTVKMTVDVSVLESTGTNTGDDLVTEGTVATNANDLTVLFNAKGTSSVSIDSIATKASDLSIVGADSNWFTAAQISTALTNIESALATLRDTGQSLATNLSVVQTREDFTSEFINTLEEGSDKWTLADSNLEGANMLMLQTRQQLGTVSLSIASQAAQSILRLFG